MDEQTRIAIAVTALDDMKKSGDPTPHTPRLPPPPEGSSFTPSSASANSSIPSTPTTTTTGTEFDDHDDSDDDEAESDTPQLSSHMPDTSGISPPSANGHEHPPVQVQGQGALSRTLQLPLVNSAVQLYEQGRERSRVVKYASNLMQSSLTTIGERLPPGAVAGAVVVDEIVGRGWERLDSYRRRPTPITSPSPTPQQDDVDMTSSPEGEAPSSGPRHQQQQQQQQQQNSQNSGQLTNRNALQSLFLEAGGLSVALSEESMRRLKYVLGWLMYATAHVDAQILVLREFIASVGGIDAVDSPHPSSSSINGATKGRKVTKTQLQTLHAVRADLVKTVKQAVAIVSQYAGGMALTDDARGRVRGFVLGLPGRWARAAKETAGPSTPQAHASTSSLSSESSPSRRVHRSSAQRGVAPYPAPAPTALSSSAVAHPRVPSGSSIKGKEKAMGEAEYESPDVKEDESTEEVGSTVVAAKRILTLATESLDMMRGVTGVVQDSLGRADAWVERFRAVGLHNDSTTPPQTENGNGCNHEAGCSGHTLEAERLRRMNISSDRQSQEKEKMDVDEASDG